MPETGCSGLVCWDNPEGWDREGGERGVQDGRHMYTKWLSHVNVWQKSPQCCKVISLQLKKKKEPWRRLPFPPPGDLPDLGIESVSPAFPALGGRFFTTGKECQRFLTNHQKRSGDKEEIFFLQPSEETSAADTLVSNFLPPESETIDFCCLSHFKYFGSLSIVTYQREGTDLGG